MRGAAVAIILLGAFGACSSASGLNDDGVRVNLYRGAQFGCSGVRVQPTVVLTARHCVRATPLTLNGARIEQTDEYFDRDIAVYACEPGPFTPVARLRTRYVTAHLQDGTFDAELVFCDPQISDCETQIAFDHACRPGDSGSPVTTVDGVVAIVVACHTSDGVHCDGNPPCYADLTVGFAQ